jgi:hypothetical protein
LGHWRNDVTNILTIRHPFYTRLNALLDAADFDRFVEPSVGLQQFGVFDRRSDDSSRELLASG